MLISLLHKIVAFPTIYDIVQNLAGASITKKIIQEEFSDLPKNGKALDVGGGTGRMRPFLPKTWEYTCLDSDPIKLRGFTKKYPIERSILASATSIPQKNNIFDLCIMSAVSHHLDEAEFAKALKEIARVLKPNGKLFYLDAIWNPKNISGRFLWNLDRGSYPRSHVALKVHIKNVFAIVEEKKWSKYHEYVIIWCINKAE
jgi:ubiquinone/menaquinone biosynthesis C-methylase UbiE